MQHHKNLAIIHRETYLYTRSHVLKYRANIYLTINFTNRRTLFPTSKSYLPDTFHTHSPPTRWESTNTTISTQSHKRPRASTHNDSQPARSLTRSSASIPPRYVLRHYKSCSEPVSEIQSTTPTLFFSTTVLEPHSSSTDAPNHDSRKKLRNMFHHPTCPYHPPTPPCGYTCQLMPPTPAYRTTIHVPPPYTPAVEGMQSTRLIRAGIESGKELSQAHKKVHFTSSRQRHSSSDQEVRDTKASKMVVPRSILRSSAEMLPTIYIVTFATDSYPNTLRSVASLLATQIPLRTPPPLSSYPLLSPASGIITSIFTINKVPLQYHIYTPSISDYSHRPPPPYALHIQASAPSSNRACCPPPQHGKSSRAQFLTCSNSCIRLTRHPISPVP